MTNILINLSFLNKTENKQNRQDYPIEFLIIHHTAGYYNSDVRQFLNKRSGVSIHYYITSKGEIIQFVGEDKIAYHTGPSNKGPVKKDNAWGWNLNPYSIGIELESGPSPDFTEIQREALIKLTKDILKRNKQIKIENILGHYEITTRKVDPAPQFFLNRMDGFRKFIKEDMEKDKNNENNINNNNNENMNEKIDNLENNQYKNLKGYKIFNDLNDNSEIKKLIEIGLYNYNRKLEDGTLEIRDTPSIT